VINVEFAGPVTIGVLELREYLPLGQRLVAEQVPGMPKRPANRQPARHGRVGAALVPRREVAQAGSGVGRIQPPPHLLPVRPVHDGEPEKLRH
jgi:hypothetical protein